MMMVIRMMEEAERAQVALFVREIMRKQYHCEAHELPSLVLIAKQGAELVGAIALSLSNGGLLPLEEAYALEYSKFPVIFDRAKIVQLGRWVATVPDVSEALVYGAVLYSIGKGREWAIGEVKPCVVRRYSRMGLRLHVLAGRPSLEKIPPAVLPYYTLPPRPSPCAFFLEEVLRILEKRLTEAISQNKFFISAFH